MSAAPADFMLGLAITAMRSVYNNLVNSDRDCLYTQTHKQMVRYNKAYAACVGMNPAAIVGSDNICKRISTG